MPKIRNLLQLQDQMAKEFAWRKKELSALKTLVETHKKTPKCDLCVRMAIPILYAHWEGFVKSIGTSYLEFVSRQKLKHEELPANFLALSINSIIVDASNAQKIQPKIELTDFFQTKMQDRSDIKWRTAINTQSNLSSSVFQNIALMLGIDYSLFATKEKLMDERLLNNRNMIAHGQFTMVGVDEYDDLHQEVKEIMQLFYNQVENAAVSGDYIRTAK